MKKIIERWYNLFGYEIHIRMEPEEFKEDMRHLYNLVDDHRWDEYKVAYEAACKRWDPNDPELIRASTFATIYMEEDEEATSGHY